MKVKDLADYTNISDILVEVPLEIQKRDPYYKEGDPKIVGKIISQWDKGIWLCKPEVSKTRIFPFFLESLKEVLEFEIITQETTDNDTGNNKTSSTMVEK